MLMGRPVNDSISRERESDSVNSCRNLNVLLCSCICHYGSPPASVGLLTRLPTGQRSKAISHYDMLLVLSRGPTRFRWQGPSLAPQPHTLRNTVLIFTLPHPAKSNQISLWSQIHPLTLHSNVVMSSCG